MHMYTAVDQGFKVIVDSGCTQSATGQEDDFIPGLLVEMPTPGKMQGISGNLTFTRQGIVSYKLQTTGGERKHIETWAYLIPELGECCLLSPQDFLQCEQEQERGKRANGWTSKQLQSCFCIYKDFAEFEWESGDKVRAMSSAKTGLPTLFVYWSLLTSLDISMLQGCVTDDANQNLTRLQEMLLHYHYRLGHLGFQWVQWLEQQGWLVSSGQAFGHGRVLAPKCAACLYGHQHWTSIPTKHVRNDLMAALSVNKLISDELVFSDQYESGMPGRSFKGRGLATSEGNYTGGTLFCDAASGYIYVSHQVALTTAETIQSKMKFECYALHSGVRICGYHTDNSIYTSSKFMKELASQGQGLKLSRVDAKFQNGKAENAIKIVTQCAWTMMIHAGLCWPKMYDKELWPMALSHAAYLHNHTPNQESGLALVEVFTQSKSDHTELLNAHPWGCPAYVFKPRLRNGQKILKWEPWLHCGQYMGVSPLHASTVGLVQNLSIGNIMPQHHVVYDDFFETVSASETKTLEVWEDLIVFSCFKNDTDNPHYEPELADEWLNPQELAKQQAERAKQAASGPKLQAEETTLDSQKER